MNSAVDRIKNGENIEVSTIDELVSVFEQLKEAGFTWRTGEAIKTDYDDVKLYMVVLEWRPLRQEWKHLVPHGKECPLGTDVLGYFKYDKVVIFPFGENSICFEREGDVTPTGEELFKII